MPGYSNAATWKKLGIKEGMQVISLHAPDNYREILGGLPPLAVLGEKLRKNASFIHYFAMEKGVLSRNFPKLKESLLPDGALWISWPKAASRVPTDLTDQVVREIGLRNGLVDVKIAAIDEIWSGLKFVYRLKDRKK